MEDEFHLGNGNWWEASRNRFDGVTTPISSNIPTTLNSIASFGWPSEMAEMVSSRSSMYSATVSDGGSMVLQAGTDQSSTAGGGGGGLADPNLQMMELGLSSQSLDWNKDILGGKGEGNIRSLLQEDSAAASSQEQWRLHKFYSGDSSDDSSANDFKQINRGFSLDNQLQFSSQASSNDSTIASSQNLATGFCHVDSYGLLLSDQNQPRQNSAPNHHRPIINYPYPSSGYGAELVQQSSSKYPQFLRTSPLKQAAPLPLAVGGGSHLHFTKNAPFWNASPPPPAPMTSSFFPALQTRHPAPSFDGKPKSTLDVTTKKNSTETSNKRARNETPSALPAFKARKEKMRDRITALQQLVSPFGKTDTASVLSEAIDYIKFLLEQVIVLSSPYIKNGAPIQHQQQSAKSKDAEGATLDLRSRGLCLVPVSSTFPMTHEPTVDIWTPSFGGTFR